MFAKVKKFIPEVRTEFKKVSWPTRNEIIASALIVLFFIIILAIYVGIVDVILSRVITFLIR